MPRSCSIYSTNVANLIELSELLKVPYVQQVAAQEMEEYGSVIFSMIIQPTHEIVRPDWKLLNKKILIIGSLGAANGVT